MTKFFSVHVPVLVPMLEAIIDQFGSSPKRAVFTKREKLGHILWQYSSLLKAKRNFREVLNACYDKTLYIMNGIRNVMKWMIV